MSDRKPPVALIAATTLALLIAGGLYAKKTFQPPEAPPQLIWTKRGAVLLYHKAQLGDVITAPDIDTIYYLASDGKRVVFPDEQTYNSWYGDFTAVKTIPRDVLESYPLSGRNVTIRPGTYLVKIQSSPQVSLIGFPNVPFWFADGAPQVKALFGEQWENRLVDIPEYYFTNYQEPLEVHGKSLLPSGTLFHVTENDGWYLITPEGLRPVTEQGLTANHFQKKFAVERQQIPSADVLAKPLDGYESRWGSPDIYEQSQDHGPALMKTGGAQPEVG